MWLTDESLRCALGSEDCLFGRILKMTSVRFLNLSMFDKRSGQHGISGDTRQQPESNKNRGETECAKPRAGAKPTVEKSVPESSEPQGQSYRQHKQTDYQRQKCHRGSIHRTQGVLLTSTKRKFRAMSLHQSIEKNLELEK